MKFQEQWQVQHMCPIGRTAV